MSKTNPTDPSGTWFRWSSNDVSPDLLTDPEPFPERSARAAKSTKIMYLEKNGGGDGDGPNFALNFTLKGKHRHKQADADNQRDRDTDWRTHADKQAGADSHLCIWLAAFQQTEQSAESEHNQLRQN